MRCSVLQSTANPSGTANAAWETPVAAAALAGGHKGLTHSTKHPQEPAHSPGFPLCHPHPSILHPSTAYRTHLPATSEQAEEVPACSEEETEAHCLSSQRDSAGAPPAPRAWKCLLPRWKTPQCQDGRIQIFHSPRHTPFAPLKPEHQAWHHSQAWASGRAACPSPKQPRAATGPSTPPHPHCLPSCLRHPAP